MFKMFLKYYQDRFLSRWTVFFFDLSATFFSLIVALFSLNFRDFRVQSEHDLISLATVILVYGFAYLLIGSYKGILRHTSVDDVLKVLKAVFLGGLVSLIVSLFYSTIYGANIFPISTISFHFTLTFIALVGLRLAAKSIYIAGTYHNINQIRVVIFGCGDSGLMTKNAIQQEQHGKFKVVAFLDDNANRWGKQLQDIKIHSPNLVLSQEWLNSQNINQLIIAVQSMTPQRKRQISEAAIELGLEVKIVPPYRKWIQGSISVGQLKAIEIEDLLQRNKIELDSLNISESVNNKIVLVTGAAGSIGSEIARQLSYYSLEKLVLIDHAESPLYDIEQELKEKHRTLKTVVPICEVANVKDKYRMSDVFERYQPDIVYHAAAYKHVPLIEKNPYEGIFVNILGTRIVADLALEFGVERFVMVSTDKAVNPTNVMGATKRVAELYTQSLNEYDKTKFIATRFGNVLGSNGSVVPLFRKQIENGGPITVTHEEITRYFMTIPEACNLVLEAGAMGEGGEVFVFDMGEPVKIIDMAKKMIKLSGLQLNKEITIEITGLRPGEKLYEELLASSENTLPTHHPKIMRAKVKSYGHAVIKRQLDLLSEIMIDGDIVGMVRKVKSIVPEYKSKNSEFEALD